MKFISILFILTVVSANNLRSETDNSLNTIECKEMEHPKCLKWNNKTQGCSVIDCWKYDKVAGCEKAGKPWVPAIILQSIPFTGFFGSGFGNIGRWDIFSMYMAGFFGPLAIICLFACCTLVCSSRNSDDDYTTMDDKTAGISILTTACGCVWTILVVVLWIWGIVTIASKDIEAPWVSANGTKIMCPMV